MKRGRISLILVLATIALLAGAAETWAATHLVRADGTGDFPTIQAAIDAAAAGDTVSLADGTYVGVGNRDINFGGKALVLRSQAGDPTNCIINCSLVRRGFVFESGEDTTSVVEAISITRGSTDSSGGGIYCRAGSSPRIVDCLFFENVSDEGPAIACVSGSNPEIIGCTFSDHDAYPNGDGGAIYCLASSPIISGCSFIGNRASWGGGIYCRQFASPTITDCFFEDNYAVDGGAISFLLESNPTVTGCTFWNNYAWAGGALYGYPDCFPTVSHCTFVGNEVGGNGSAIGGVSFKPTVSHSIIAFGIGDVPVSCDPANPALLDCCNVFGNSEGDWVGGIASQEGINGNISVNPLFCGLSNGDFTLALNSLCAAENNVECGQIGAWPIGCGPACDVALSPAEIVTYYPGGSSFSVDLGVESVVDLGAFSLCTGYDGAFLEVTDVTVDPTFLGSTGRTVEPLDPVPCAPSCQSDGIRYGASTTGVQPGATGGGTLATLSFLRISDGAATDVLCGEDFQAETTEDPPQSIAALNLLGTTLTHRSFCYGDFDDDGDVSIADVAPVANRWGCCDGDPCYDVLYDGNLLAPGNYSASIPDGCIDIIDVQSVASRWGQECPGVGGPLASREDAGTTPIAARLETGLETGLGTGLEARSGTREDPIEAVGPGTDGPGEDGPATFDAETWLRMSPTSLELFGEPGDTASFVIAVENASDLAAFEATITFDPSVVGIEDVVILGFLESTGRNAYLLGPEVDDETGQLTFGAWSLGESAGASGSGPLARVTLSLRSCSGRADLAFTDVTVTDPQGWPLPVAGTEGSEVTTDCAPSATGPGEFTDSPNSWDLLPARPNPFGQTTSIRFAVPTSARVGAIVDLRIVDAAGRRVRHLTRELRSPGYHQIEWDGRGDGGNVLPSGTYFCQLRAAGMSLERRVVRLR